MATRRTGISRDLIFHPGETIAELLEERGLTQSDLAISTGVSEAHISNIVSGKKDISSEFAMKLEYAFGVPCSFWLNLQANYDAEMAEYNERCSITDDEHTVLECLKEVVRYLRNKGLIPKRGKNDDIILSIRKALHISNIADLNRVVPEGAFRISGKSRVDGAVLGAWIRICQLKEQNHAIAMQFNVNDIDVLVAELKAIMCSRGEICPLKTVTETMARYGINFFLVRNFRGAPVQGYMHLSNDGAYSMFLTLRGASADIFWFSLFHELGHIVAGDVRKRFIDTDEDSEKERIADRFASEHLLPSESFQAFVSNRDFTISSIKRYSESQGVPPYIVIGRLQREEYIRYSSFSEYKPRYKQEDFDI